MFLQNKNKEMETRLHMPASQEIFETLWFSLKVKVNFISLFNPSCAEAYSEPSTTSRMELSAYVDNGGKLHLGCLDGF